MNGQRASSLIGSSSTLKHIRHSIMRAGSVPYPVLITGETGTGKELVARAIHAQSPRHRHPFIALSCGGVSRDLTPSILFGHAKGAFTGAHQESTGLFHAAREGTLFLDEIETMTPDMQACLLRTIETGEARRVGDSSSVPVDVRIISASNAPMASLIEQSLFRRDLYYRLSVITVHLPPLRERQEDIPLLVEHFLRAAALETESTVRDITADAMDALTRYPWPGNVRELQSAIRQACLFAPTDTLTADDFHFLWKPTWPMEEVMTVKEYARDAIERYRPGMTLKALAHALGVSRKTLWTWRKELAPTPVGQS